MSDPQKSPATFRESAAGPWRFVVPGVPRTKRGARPGRGGHMHADTGEVHYEMLVAGAAIGAGLAAGDGPCEVRIELLLPSRRRKDADRVTTAIFDGLKRAGAAALADDNLMVIQRTVIELAGIDKAAPRAIVTVTMLERDRSK